MLASAGSGKTYRPSRTCEVSFWKTSSISVRATPSRRTTSTSCETRRTPVTTSVLPGTRAVIRPSPRGPASVAIVGCALTTVRRGSTATWEAERSGGRPFARFDRFARQEHHRLAPASLQRELALFDGDRGAILPSGSHEHRAADLRIDLGRSPRELDAQRSGVRPAAELSHDDGALRHFDVRARREVRGALVSEVQVGGGAESESRARAPGALHERAGRDALVFGERGAFLAVAVAAGDRRPVAARRDLHLEGDDGPFFLRSCPRIPAAREGQS